MGQTFGNLTNTALVDPNGQMQWFSPRQSGQAAIQLAKDQMRQVQPDTAQLSDGGNVSFAPADNAFTKMIKPSFLQAATGPTGMPNATSPGLSKMGKLVTLFTGGLEGALAAQQAQEQMIAQTGGKRAGGVGTGFEAGFQLPFLRAQQQNELLKGQAEAGLAQAGLQPVQTPYGNLPAALAPKILTPALNYEGRVGAANIGAQGRVESSQIGAQSRENVAKINQGQAIPVDETTARLAGFPELAGQSAGRATWTNINKVLEARGYRVQDMGQNGTGDNEGMWLMDRAGNRVRQVSPNSLTFQRGASFAQNRPEVVTDPNDPGYAYYTTAANAMRNNLPAPQGAATTAAKREATSEVPTKIGDQKVAFNTAIQHADLLKQAVTALNNGNQTTLNSLANRFNAEFGGSGPVTAQAIADAYGREVTKMLTGGHLTDSEVGTIGSTLNVNRQSPQQTLGVINAYRALAQSKLNVLGQQASSSSHRTRTPSGGASNVNDLLKKHGF